MPSGKAHRQIALATTPFVIIAGWTFSGFTLDLETWGAIGVVTIGYLCDPFFLSPDMDLPRADPSQAWGKLRHLWLPYQLLLHRTSLSHLPPMSAVIRLFYLWFATFFVFCSSIFLIDLMWFGLFKQTAIEFVPDVWLGWWLVVLTLPQFWHFLMGLCLGDAVHYAADILLSFAKK